jgi:hypothetical protein
MSRLSDAVDRWFVCPGNLVEADDLTDGGVPADDWEDVTAALGTVESSEQLDTRRRESIRQRLLTGASRARKRRRDDDSRPEPDEGGAGAREPRRPRPSDDRDSLKLRPPEPE